MSPQGTSRRVGGVSAEVRPVKSTPGEKQSGRKVGGVSAKGQAEHLPWLEEQPGGPRMGPIAPIHGDFIYNGGPVITCPLIYTSFWGSLWLSDPTLKSVSDRLS
jgi:hypothetical protein